MTMALPPATITILVDNQAGPDLAAEHGLALWIRTDQGLVICVGCCHAGLINTLTHIRRLNDGLPVRAVIGGLHLINADRRRLDETVAALQRLAVEKVIPCHCTGERAVSVLKTTLDAEVQAGVSGAVCRF